MTPNRPPHLRNPLPWPLLLALVALLGGCRPGPALTVNGTPITLDDLDDAARAAGVLPDDPDLHERLILDTLLQQDAAAQGLSVDAVALEAAMAQATAAAGGAAALQRRVREAGFSVRRYRHDLERRLLTAAYLDRLADEVRLDDDDLRTHFEANRDSFTEPERFSATLLLYPDRATADAARRALLDGGDLDGALAAAAPGSGATELSASETAPERRALLAAAYGTPFASPSEPLPYRGSLALVVPTGHRIAYRPTFDEVAPSLRAQLEQVATQSLLRTRLATLRTEADVVWGVARPPEP